MAAALTNTLQMNVGQTLKVTGTGFANTTAYTARFGFPGKGHGAPTILAGGTTSGAGVVDLTGICEVTPSEEGDISVTVSDGSATVTETIKVWRTS